ncbi:MAG: acyl carrier protein [Magnetococcales bacterium]|nr:acyl carrier protein [Magnetococcales bacterium]
MKETQEKIKAYIVNEILENESPGELENDTPLISSGIIDSTSAVTMVGFLEVTFGVKFDHKVLTQDNLDSINAIASLVKSVQKSG